MLFDDFEGNFLSKSHLFAFLEPVRSPKAVSVPSLISPVPLFPLQDSGPSVQSQSLLISLSPFLISLSPFQFSPSRFSEWSVQSQSRTDHKGDWTDGTRKSRDWTDQKRDWTDQGLRLRQSPPPLKGENAAHKGAKCDPQRG